MAKLIGIDGQDLVQLYLEGISAVKSTLWKPRGHYAVSHEGLIDRLRVNGVSLACVNFGLYKANIPYYIGSQKQVVRFPEILEVFPDLSNNIHNVIDSFYRREGSNKISSETRARTLTREITRVIAEEIGFGPRTLEFLRL